MIMNQLKNFNHKKEIRLNTHTEIKIIRDIIKKCIKQVQTPACYATGKAATTH